MAGHNIRVGTHITTVPGEWLDDRRCLDRHTEISPEGSARYEGCPRRQCGGGQQFMSHSMLLIRMLGTYESPLGRPMRSRSPQGESISVTISYFKLPLSSRSRVSLDSPQLLCFCNILGEPIRTSYDGLLLDLYGRLCMTALSLALHIFGAVV